MKTLIPSTTNNLPIAVTSRGAVELGLDNPIRNVINTDRVGTIAKLEAMIKEIWEHYCGADPSMLTTPFVKEAKVLILDKFGGLGLNEIREAFRLASVNVIDCNLTAYGGKISLQTIGKCLDKYVEYRKPIASEVIKKRMEQEKEKQTQADIDKKEKYEKEVIAWFMSGKKATREECRFYMLDTLMDKKIVEVDVDFRKQCIAQAVEELRQEALKIKANSSTVQDIRDARKIMDELIENKAVKEVNIRAKEIALFKIKNSK